MRRFGRLSLIPTLLMLVGAVPDARPGVPTDEVAHSRSFVVGFHGTFPAGTYTVSWRGMGADGHVVRDTFQFSVEAH